MDKMSCFPSLIITLIIIGLTKITVTLPVSQSQCGKLERNFETGGDIAIPWATVIKINGQPESVKVATLITPNLLLAKAAWFTLDDNFGFFPFNRYVAYVGKQRVDDVPKWPYPKETNITHIRIFPTLKDLDPWYCMDPNLVLIHLAESVVLQNIMPICLPDSSFRNSILQNGSKIWATGWSLKSSYTELVYEPFEVEKQSTCESIWPTVTDGRKDNCSFASDRFCGKFIGTIGNRCTSGGTGITAMDPNSGQNYLVGHGSLDFGNKTFGQHVCTKDTMIYSNPINGTILEWIHNNTVCGPHNYTCDNGQCVHISSMCNTIKDCDDGSDENSKVCNGFTYPVPCSTDQIGCVTTGICVSKGESCEIKEQRKFGITFWVAITTAVSITLVGIMFLIHTIRKRQEMKRIGKYETLVDDGTQPPTRARKIFRKHKPELIDICEPPVSGSSGVSVYKMEHKTRGFVVLKIQSIQAFMRKFRNDDLAERVLFEPKLLHQARKCPNIVEYYEHWTEPCWYPLSWDKMLSEFEKMATSTTEEYNLLIVLERLDVLLECWVRETTPSYSVLIDAFLQIASGLQHLHSLNIIHLDIRLPNIMGKIEQNGTMTWKLIDLDLSRKVKGTGDVMVASLFKTGDSVYTSPEIKEGRFTMQTDVFSLGLVFLWCIFKVGQENWDNDTRGLDKLALFNDVRNGKDPLTMLEIRHDLVDITKVVVKPMLKLDPAERVNINDVVRNIRSVS